MDGDSHFMRALDQQEENRIAVIDVGSNSVRLVVYDGRGRASQSIFNEKTACGLGSDLEGSGRLSARGVACVTDVLERFVRIARSLDVKVIDAFATAAVRDAANGNELIERIRRLAGIQVDVLSGTEEGRLSAEGVLASMPGADGAMGDLGGGSLELVALDAGDVGTGDTMPIGTLRLLGAHGGDLAAMRKAVRRSIGQIDWLPAVRDRSFVAVGGAWRALARVYMNATDAPVHMVQGLTVETGRLKTFLAEVAKGAYKDERFVRGLSGRRIEVMPLASVLLAEVIERAVPARVMFSAFGVREGRLMRHMSAEERARDPLLAACADISADTPRFRITGDDVFAWTSPLFPDERSEHRRMRRAACIVGDIGWREHPDYRAEQAFRRLLLMPAVGIDHAGRAWLASAVYARYTQHFEAPFLAPARALLSDTEFVDATVAGGALRLAYEMSGGDRDLLLQTRLERTRDALALHLEAAIAPLVGNTAERRLGQLARRAGLRPELRVGRRVAAA
jgi:exopolyphosphatase / guanosine-5'-triphosphate,3'-diphosphate pyrophosphatase